MSPNGHTANMTNNTTRTGGLFRRFASPNAQIPLPIQSAGIEQMRRKMMMLMGGYGSNVELIRAYGVGSVEGLHVWMATLPYVRDGFV